MIDLLTMATAKVAALLRGYVPEDAPCPVIEWPARPDDIEVLPWVEVGAEYAGVDDVADQGDLMIVAVDIMMRADAPEPGEFFAWVFDALGRSRTLGERLTDDEFFCKRAEFDPPSSRERGADYWQRIVNINLICQINC